MTRPRLLTAMMAGLALIAVSTQPAGATVSGENGRIAFVTERGGSEGIYVMSGDGGPARFLAPGRDPAWSPDGSTIAYAHDFAIRLMSADGTGSTQVTFPETEPNPPEWSLHSIDRAPAWSPDGARLAFVRHFSGPTPTAGLSRLYAADDRAQAPVMLADIGWSADIPDWSPDGTRIVIGSIGAHRTSLEIMVVHADGSGSVRLPAPPRLSYRSQPAWSPDGASIAATVFDFIADTVDIFVMDADGRGAINLTSNPALDSDPAWQPRNPYPTGLVDPATGIWHLRGRDGSVTSFYYGNPGDSPMIGDWDCDGVATPGLYRRSDGHVYLRNSNTQGPADIRFHFGNPGDVPLAGDFDGDGCDTVSVYRPTEGKVYVINRQGSGGLGAADSAYYFGNPGDIPFAGDFDGDGVDTVALFRGSTGLVYLRNSHTQGPADVQFVFGDPGDLPVAFDWDGDGVDSPGLFRPGAATFFLRFTNTQGIADARYISGRPGWVPVAAEFGFD